MKLAPIIAPIQAECPSFTQVAGALTDDLEKVISQGKLPAAYVVRLDEDGEILEDMGNECYQEITEYFAVVSLTISGQSFSRLCSGGVRMRLTTISNTQVDHWWR